MDHFKKLYDLNQWSMYIGYLESLPKERRDKGALKIAKKICAAGKTTWLDETWPDVIYKQIKKYRNDKPRDVYYYPEPYQTALKLLNHIIMQDHEIIDKFSFAALAYIPNRSIKQATRKINKFFAAGYRHYFKTDFTNYFNNIDAEILIDKLDGFFYGKTLDFFTTILRKENKGAMAGSPLSGLWANIYMNDIDHLMHYVPGVKYLRYADDVLIMSKEPVDPALFITATSNIKIKLSEKKTWHGTDEVVFLGFKINKNEVDVSEKALAKIKSSMRRRRKWFNYQADNRLYKNKNYALYKYIHGVNQKLFTRESEDGTAWLEWYAPAITTPVTLKKLEIYFLKQVTALHGKKDYSHFTTKGYRSITNEYYRFLLLD